MKINHFAFSFIVFTTAVIGFSSASFAATNIFNVDGIAMNIFGATDARTVVSNPESQLYRMVGRVTGTIGNRVENCTGSLVAPDVVLTNLHCVANIVASNLDPSVVSFEASYNQGKSIASSGVIDIISKHARDSKGISYDSFKGDWALLILDEPIGNTVINKLTGEKLGWFTVAAKTADLQKQLAPDADVKNAGLVETPLFTPIKVAMSGYSGDINQNETMWTQSTCAIKGIDPFGRVLHNCNNTPGSSGSPIFVQTDQGPEIAALNAGFLMGKDRLAEGVWIKADRYAPSIANTGIDTQYFYDAVQTQLKKSAARQEARGN